MNDTSLLEQHTALIRQSGISDEVATTRGYRSASKKSELRFLGFSDSQAIVPALVIPIWNVNGEVAFHQIRPDKPRTGQNGKTIKYETPRGTRMTLDVHPMIRKQLGDPAIPLFFTEGIRKGDSAVSRGLCCIPLLGVWNWRGKNEFGANAALTDFEVVVVKKRVVPIVFDSDVMTKDAVYLALSRFKRYLESLHAQVLLVYLPPGPDGSKVGLDDYLAAGHSVDDLMSLATSELRQHPGVDREERDHPYRISPAGLFWQRQTEAGAVPVQLTNFTAQIVSDITEDDGLEPRQLFELEAHMNTRTVRFTIPASRFSSMNWATENLGASAIVFPGSTLRDHARAAVQVLSKEIPRKQIFTHLGWRGIGNQWVYLHAGGAIGPAGSIPEIDVNPPDALRLFALPDPPPQAELHDAVRASLELLSLAPPRITVPLFAALYRAPLGNCDFSIHIAGESGEGKTALAVLAQQHQGPGLDALNVPGSWLSTGNAIEGIAFSAKDALLLVDDFAPTGSAADIQRFHREADRIFRAQGNRSGRHRMRSDSTLRPPRPPRGIILSTGEDVPRGVSLRARLMILELERGAIDWKKLTTCQANAASGLYAQAFAGYIHWLAPQMDRINRDGRDEMRSLRDKATQSGQHRRTPAMVASLAFALQKFLEFSLDVGGLSASECKDRESEWWKALGEAASQQPQHHAASEPTKRFLQLLGAAIASGHAHVAGPDGGSPDTPQAWGWRISNPATPNETIKPLGDRIGWVQEDNLYLEPDAAYAVAQAVGKDTSDVIGLTSRTLHKRLHERRFLLSTDPTRNTLTIRRILEGARRGVLHLRADSLVRTKTDQPDQDDPEPPLQQPNAWSVGWAGSDIPPRQTDQQTDQQNPGAEEASIANGQVGQVLKTVERVGLEVGGDIEVETI